MTTTVTYPVLTEEQFMTMADDYSQVTYADGRRPLSSVVLSEEVLGEAPPKNSIRYIEIPVIKEIVTEVPVKSIVEVEKIVPQYDIEYIEKVVEVPEIHYIDREVETEHIQEVVVEVPGEVQVVDVPRTVIRKVPKIQYVEVEQIVEIPGEVIDITKQHVDMQPIKKYTDTEVPVVVAQTIRPVITTSEEVVDVDVVEYEPQITPVDIYIATPISSKLVAVGAEQDIHQCVAVPPAQYNTILKSLNNHIPDGDNELPYIKTNGVIGFLNDAEAPGYIPLDDDIPIHEPKDYKDASYNSGDGKKFEPRGLGQKPGKKSVGIPDKKKRTCGC